MHPAYPSLDLPYIQQHLAHASIGHTIMYHTSIPSTMPIAAALAQDPSTPSGVVVVAEEQTSGRGRRGRTWRTPYASSLLTSIILKPPHSHLPPATLTMIAGNALLAAVIAVVPALADTAHLKWPNDLVIGNDPAAARKAAGILAESHLKPDGSTEYAILGIGINVNQQASDLPRIAPPTPRPTSLRLASHPGIASIPAGIPSSTASQPDQLIDRDALLIHLCQQLAQQLTLTAAESYQTWRANLATLGHSVAVYQQGVEQPATLIGRAVDVQTDGALIVEEANGTRHIFHAADVSVRAL